MPKLPDHERLFDALPQDGEFVTNKEIRDRLKLKDDRYWQVRDQLLKQGKIIIGRGYGGRVARRAFAEVPLSAISLGVGANPQPKPDDHRPN
jgi:hypothetical protein